jgi:hypothetical protein
VTSDEKTKLDRLLNRALAEYSKAEPRSGIELRVLSNLRRERRRMAEKRQLWWWTIGIAATTAVLAIMLWTGRARGHAEQSATVTQQATPITGQDGGPDITQESAAQASQQPASSRRRHLQRAGRRVHRRRPLGVLRAARRERGEQFPSPMPLNEQEKILQLYVEQYKNDAILTARAQTELAKKEDKEIAATSATIDESFENDEP